MLLRGMGRERSSQGVPVGEAVHVLAGGASIREHGGRGAGGGAGGSVRADRGGDHLHAPRPPRHALPPRHPRLRRRARPARRHHQAPPLPARGGAQRRHPLAHAPHLHRRGDEDDRRRRRRQDPRPAHRRPRHRQRRLHLRHQVPRRVPGGLRRRAGRADGRARPQEEPRRRSAGVGGSAADDLLVERGAGGAESGAAAAGGVPGGADGLRLPGLQDPQRLEALLERELDAPERGVLPGAGAVRPDPVRGERAGALHVRAVRWRAQDVPGEGVRQAGDSGVHPQPRHQIPVGEGLAGGGHCRRPSPHPRPWPPRPPLSRRLKEKDYHPAQVMLKVISV